MPKKKRPSTKQVDIKVGSVSDVSGNMNIAGGNITTQHTTTDLSTARLARLFDELYTLIESRADTSSTDKDDLKMEVREIQSVVTEAAKKNENVNEEFLARRLRNIARISPDILDVVVATFANPLAGLGLAVKKIAEKAKEGIGGT
ncbi:MAG TPA: hypothetical protein VK897_16290 [Anaerolineales bacterium]|nr:hypothetical protein [Anaerolineales bacterium]